MEGRNNLNSLRHGIERLLRSEEEMSGPEGFRKSAENAAAVFANEKRTSGEIASDRAGREPAHLYIIWIKPPDLVAERNNEITAVPRNGMQDRSVVGPLQHRVLHPPEFFAGDFVEGDEGAGLVFGIDDDGFVGADQIRRPSRS